MFYSLVNMELKFTIYFITALPPALCHFSESILEYLANLDKAPDPTVRKDTFASEIYSAFDILFNNWLQSRESKVRWQTIHSVWFRLDKCFRFKNIFYLHLVYILSYWKSLFCFRIVLKKLDWLSSSSYHFTATICFVWSVYLCDFWPLNLNVIKLATLAL